MVIDPSAARRAVSTVGPAGWGQPLPARSVKQVEAALGERIAGPPYVDRWQYRAGNLLTPQVISEVFTLADYGYLYRQADLFDELRETDAHLHSVLSRRESAVAGADYELRPPEDTGDDGKRVCEYVKDVLEHMDPHPDFGLCLSDAVMHLQGGLYQGRAVLETVWDKAGVKPLSLERVHARRLAMADDWRLHLWDQSGSATDQYGTNTGGPFTLFPGLPLSAFPRGKFIVHVPWVRGAYPQRDGLGRVVTYYSCFKKFGIRDLLALCAWAGRGIRKGKYHSGKDPANPEPASDEDVAVLKTALDAMSSEISLVIPDTTDVEIIKVGEGSTKIHEAIVHLCNSEESKAVLTNTLTTEVGETGGNRALGQVQEKGEAKLAAMDEKAIGRTLRRDLFAPAAVRKFGDGAARFAPTIHFATEPVESREDNAKRVKNLVDAGARIKHTWLSKAQGYETDVPVDSDAVLVPMKPVEVTPMSSLGSPGAPDKAPPGAPPPPEPGSAGAPAPGSPPGAPTEAPVGSPAPPAESAPQALPGGSAPAPSPQPRGIAPDRPGTDEAVGAMDDAGTAPFDDGEEPRHATST